MHLLCIAATLATFSSAAAHTLFTTLFVNDVDQGDGTCVRMPMTSHNATFPVNNLASNDMACGYEGHKGVARVCSVTQGAKLTFQWREWADNSYAGSIDISHRGPCAVYMKSVSSAIKDPGHGPGWFKIWDSGYDTTTKQWCSESLIENNGFLSVILPDDLAGGYYLVRPELLALHEADKIPPNPQFYIGCAQVFLKSSNTAVPGNTVNIPGYVHANDKSVTFNIYKPFFPYPIPGPVPYLSSLQEKAHVKVASTSVKMQTEGLIPAGCILENANWAGIELDSYNTEGGCWNASSNCWVQATTCRNEAPPTGAKNCLIWEAKCTHIQNECKAHNFNGPPNKGKSLNPALTSLISISDAIPAIDGVFSTASHSTIDLNDSRRSLTKLIQSKSQVGLAESTSAHDARSAKNQQLAISDGLEILTQTSRITLLHIPGYFPSGVASYVTNTFEDITRAGISPNPILFTSRFLVHTETASSSKLDLITNAVEAPTAATSPLGSISTLSVSRDAKCGPKFETTCQESIFGNCCSQYGWCGSSPPYCASGCQTGFGSCS